MGSIGSLIKGRRRALGLTLQQLADRARCAKSYLSEVENGKRDGLPGEELLGRLEGALGMEPGALVSVARWESTPVDLRREMVSLRAESDAARRLVALLRREGVDALYRSGALEALLGEEQRGSGIRDQASGAGEGGEGLGHRAAVTSEDEDDEAKKGDGVRLASWMPVRVPVINKVAAGYPAEFTDLGYPARVADEYVAVPEVSDPDAFAARVVGDSMLPRYAAGDLVVFSPAAATVSGSDCFVRFERDAETTFKRVYFEVDADGGELIRLQPLNSSYAPTVVPREAVAGLYAAVCVVRRIEPGV
ncbi:MAG: helix-turn-helix domain-containing protein [Phycisphaerales bacterium]